MCAHHRTAILRAALEYLACEGGAGRRFRVVVEARGLTLTLDHRGEPLPEGPAPGAGHRRLSPLEAKIVAGLAGGNWSVTADLAERIGEENSNDFRAVLRNLAAGDGALVETNQKYGVRLAGGKALTEAG